MNRNDVMLVLGGTGKTGRRVVERLRQQRCKLRIGSRSAQPAFDWEDRNTWLPALEGVASAYISYYPDVGIPGADEAIRAFSKLAVDAGVRRLVLLSGRGEEGAQRCEQAVRESGAEWTVITPSFFCQNFSEGPLAEAVKGGQFPFPAQHVTEPFIDANDIADVTCAALTQDGHGGKHYEVTGPRLMTFAEAIGEIGAAVGRQIDYVPVTSEQYFDILVSAGLPAETAGALVELFAVVLDGRNSHLSDGVQRALGRAPRDFTEYAKTTAAAGIWNE